MASLSSLASGVRGSLRLPRRLRREESVGPASAPPAVDSSGDPPSKSGQATAALSPGSGEATALVSPSPSTLSRYARGFSLSKRLVTALMATLNSPFDHGAGCRLRPPSLRGAATMLRRQFSRAAHFRSISLPFFSRADLEPSPEVRPGQPRLLLRARSLGGLAADSEI